MNGVIKTSWQKTVLVTLWPEETTNLERLTSKSPRLSGWSQVISDYHNTRFLL